MLPAHWIPAPPTPQDLRPLRQPGSLTARLARSGQASVDLLASGWGRARPDEAAALGLARPGIGLYVREVCVRLDGRPAVLARSITTLRGIRGPWKGLRRLGRRPLATLVWTDPRIRRSRFEFSWVPAASLAAARLADRPWLPARRSCFWRDGEPLIVLEAFTGLPWPAIAWQARRRRWTAHDTRA